MSYIIITAGLGVGHNRTWVAFGDRRIVIDVERKQMMLER